MIVGVLAGYGTGLRHFFKYLVPRRGGQFREMFVGPIDELPVGTAVTVTDPRGQDIVIARQKDDPDSPSRGFKALSSKCPHLGCKVHWEAPKGRFFCPCHAGVFNKDGIAIEGPPAKENRNLSTFDVRVDSDTGWVFVMVRREHRYGA